MDDLDLFEGLEDLLEADTKVKQEEIKDNKELEGKIKDSTSPGVKKITKEDCDNYDKNLAIFMEESRQKLKSKGLSNKNKEPDKLDSRTKNVNSKEVKMKEELKDVIEKHKGNVDKQKKEAEIIKKKEEAEKAKRKAEKEANTIRIDAQNCDNRKNVATLMSEGKIIIDTNDKPFILAEQHSPIYNSFNPPIHKIFCNDIESVVVRRYYEDFTLMKPGQRTLIKENIWAYHKGYETTSIISQQQLEYLVSNNFIIAKQIHYSYNDKDTGLSIFCNIPDEQNISEAQVEKEIQNYLNNRAKSNSLNLNNEDETDNNTNVDGVDIDNTNLNDIGEAVGCNEEIATTLSVNAGQ